MLLIVSACSTHNMNYQGSADINSYGTVISVKVTGNQNVSEKLSNYLQSGLMKHGFKIDQNNPKATNLTVNISEFNTGNVALRLGIGLGAGRASLMYNAKFSNDGKVFVDYNGAERFTGMELSNPEVWYSIPGPETVTLILLKAASDSILGVAFP